MMIDPDYRIALRLQAQFEKEISQPNSTHSDSLLAHQLQEQFENEENVAAPRFNLVYDVKTIKKQDSSKCLVDPSWEVVDPTPDIHILLMAFNKRFFWSALDSVCVSWSKKMTSCAGVCSYNGYGGLCSITLSEPLLKLRPRKDLVETLLHEMIHAYLFVTHNNKDRDGHGPEFHKHMYRINQESGTNITVYHDFHDEVKLYLQHWWRCDGPCQNRQPYFGMVRRAINRAPGPNDRWFPEHQRTCGGTFVKVKSPEKITKGSNKGKENKPFNDIRKYGSTDGNEKVVKEVKKDAIPSTSKLSNVHTITNLNQSTSTSITIPSKTNNINGFTSTTMNKSHPPTGAPLKNGSSTNVNTNRPKQKTEADKSKISTNGYGDKPKDNDYSVVRNHWLNKFSSTSGENARPSLGSTGSSETQNSGNHKRQSSETIDVKAKIPKTSSFSVISSVNKGKNNENCAACPVCQKLVDVESLNEHLDTCLQEVIPSEECIICGEDIATTEYEKHVIDCTEKNFNDPVIIKDSHVKNELCLECKKYHERQCPIRKTKECIICGSNIFLVDYDKHTKECVVHNLSDDVFSEPSTSNTTIPSHENDESDVSFNSADGLTSDFDEISCSSCHKVVKIENLLTHLNSCKKLKEPEYDCDTLKRCPICDVEILTKNYDVHVEHCMHKKYDDMERKFGLVDEKVECLACGKNVLKSDLNSHLDDCMSEVFSGKNDFNSDNVEDNSDGNENGENKYNCPFCLKLVLEIEMNLHINDCLNIVDDC